MQAARKAAWLDRFVFSLIAAFAAFLLAAWIWTVQDAWDGSKAIIAGPPGMVDIRDCEDTTSSRDPQFWTRGWSCTGSFKADDGRFHIDSVQLFLHAAEEPGPVVHGRVSGPNATWVWTDGEIEWIAALVLALALPFLAVLILKWAVGVLEPLDGWPRESQGRPAGRRTKHPTGRRPFRRRSR